ncbi:hypothetical protein K474DRAFT_1581967, partial [Panus rudis PR-1116 ss-1]
VREALCNEFRNRYHDYARRVQDIAVTATDSVVIARLGNDIATFTRLVTQHQNIFDPAEYALLRDSLGLLDHNIRLLHRDRLDHSHHGIPVIITEVHTGQRGRPRIVIDPQWLAWAYGHKSIAAIARFLQVSRTVVRTALLEYGLATPQENVEPAAPRITSYTHPFTNISDTDLDVHVQNLRSQFPNAGQRMMVGYLRIGLRASNNNRASTVLNVFLAA